MPAPGPRHPPPSPPGPLRVVILADDLSGAADSAVAFAARGMAARVTLGTFDAAGTEVLAVDLDSRRHGSAEASSRVRSGWHRAAELGAATVFRKIDSKLRGHVAAELLALAGCMDPHALIVVCPAHPAAGVRYRNGRPWIQGGPLDPGTDFAALAQAWQAAGWRLLPGGSAITAAALERHLTEDDDQASGPQLALVDAGDESDLDAVARLALGSARPVVLVGSGGLAAALARLTAGQGRHPRGHRSDRLPVRRGLVIAGSNAALTRSQLEHLDRTGLGRVHWQAPGCTRVADSCAGELDGDGLAAVALGGPQGVRPEGSAGILAGFVTACLPLAARAGGLVLTGGETARAILDGLGVRALEIETELAPGVVVSRAVGGWSGPIVTKSGSFGEPDALERALRLLREDTVTGPESGSRPHRTGRFSMHEAVPEGHRPIIAITLGDPAGIGPEIVVKALCSPSVWAMARPVVVGSATILDRAAQALGTSRRARPVADPSEVTVDCGALPCIDVGLPMHEPTMGRVDARCGEAAFSYVERAVALASAGRIDAICTAPLSKEALHAAGRRYPGHTEILAALTGTPEVSMMLTAPNLRVIHVTTHIGLLDAIARIDAPLVERTIRRGDRLLRQAGIAHPRIGVCAINPHAGENGLFGRGEEAEKIVPAVAACRADGIGAEGPLPADSLFFRAGRGDFDLVVAMYHDQGHGPIKVLGLEAGVNITVGLPIVRTSVDHGTAFDIAGKGLADERSLVAALRAAVDLAPRPSDVHS